jgi:hypothetical protein
LDSILRGARDFSLHHSIQTSYGAHPASCTVGMVLKHPEHETGLSLLSGTKVKYAWSYIFISPWIDASLLKVTRLPSYCIQEMYQRPEYCKAADHLENI